VFTNVYGHPSVHKFTIELVSIWLDSELLGIEVVLIVLVVVGTVWVGEIEPEWEIVAIMILGFFNPIQQHEYTDTKLFSLPL